MGFLLDCFTTTLQLNNGAFRFLLSKSEDQSESDTVFKNTPSADLGEFEPEAARN